MIEKNKNSIFELFFFEKKERKKKEKKKTERTIERKTMRTGLIESRKEPFPGRSKCLRKGRKKI